MEDEVIFTQPFGIRLYQCRRCMLQLLAGDAGGMRGEIDVPHPAAAKADQRVPAAAKWQFEDYADHAVVVILDLAIQTLAALEYQRLDRLDDRRTLVADVPRGGVLHAGMFDRAGPENLPQLVEFNLLANVELDQDKDRPLQRRV